MFFAAPDLLLRARADHITATGETRTIRLADGSVVRLGSGGALAIADPERGRTVRLLRGPACFEVVHDVRHPFRVIAGDSVTTDLGNAFEVGLHGGGSSIAVREGLVRVDDAARGVAVAERLGLGTQCCSIATGSPSGGVPVPTESRAGRGARSSRTTSRCVIVLRDEGGSTFQFLPAAGSLRPSKGRYISNSDTIGEPDWNRFNRDQYLIGSFFEHRFGDDVALRNNTRYTHLNTLYRVVVLSGDTLTTCPASIPGCIPGQTVNRRAVQGIGESDGIATDTQLEIKLATGAIRHTVLAGVDYFHTDWEHYRDLVAGARVLPILDIFNPKPRGTDGYATSLSPQIYTETVSRQNGIYLQDQIEAGRLRVTIGGRQDWARDDTFNPVNNRRFINKSDAFTWRAGGVYLFDNGLAPYASYAESFQPQVSDPSTSLGGEPFVPTTGQQYEAGLRFQRGHNIYVTLGAYQITQQNIITPDPAGTLCGTAICSVQTGEGRIRGVELEGKASLPWGMALIGTATRSSGKITESNTRAQVGNVLPQVPRWLASLFVDQRITEGTLAGIGLGGGVRYTGRSFGDTANTLAIPDDTLFDLFLRYDFGMARPNLAGLSMSVNGRNVANKRFVATCTGTAACYYGQGRSVTARLQFRW